tara:strand:+ start:136 stop:342 length:207 start_codon:yes stop_codon:yes gene_type:complete
MLLLVLGEGGENGETVIISLFDSVHPSPYPASLLPLGEFIGGDIAGDLDVDGLEAVEEGARGVLMIEG